MDKILTSFSVCSNILPYYGCFKDWKRLYSTANWESFRYWRGHQKQFKTLFHKFKSLEYAEALRDYAAIHSAYYSRPYMKNGMIWTTIQICHSPNPIDIPTEISRLENIDALMLNFETLCIDSQSDCYYQELSDVNINAFMKFLHVNKGKTFDKVHVKMSRKFQGMEKCQYKLIPRLSNDITLEFTGESQKGFDWCKSCRSQSYDKMQTSSLRDLLYHCHKLDHFTLIGFRGDHTMDKLVGYFDIKTLTYLCRQDRSTKFENEIEEDYPCYYNDYIMDEEVDEINKTSSVAFVKALIENGSLDSIEKFEIDEQVYDLVYETCNSLHDCSSIEFVKVD